MAQWNWFVFLPGDRCQGLFQYTPIGSHLFIFLPMSARGTLPVHRCLVPRRGDCTSGVPRHRRPSARVTTGLGRRQRHDVISVVYVGTT